MLAGAALAGVLGTGGFAGKAYVDSLGVSVQELQITATRIEGQLQRLEEWHLAHEKRPHDAAASMIVDEKLRRERADEGLASRVSGLELAMEKLKARRR